MSRRVWAWLGFGVVAAGLGSAAVAEPREAAKPADLAAEMETLRGTVKTLESRLEALEHRLGAVEQGTPRVLWRPDPAAPQAWPRSGIDAAAPTNLPPGADRREFNGLTYYVMPVAGSGEGGAVVATPLVATPAR